MTGVWKHFKMVKISQKWQNLQCLKVKLCTKDAVPWSSNISASINCNGCSFLQAISVYYLETGANTSAVWIFVSHFIFSLLATILNSWNRLSVYVLRCQVFCLAFLNKTGENRKGSKRKSPKLINLTTYFKYTGLVK